MAIGIAGTCGKTRPYRIYAAGDTDREHCAFSSFTETNALQLVAGAGHSLGEYSALVSAGTLSLADGVRLVRQRGAAMQDAVPVGVGAMAVVMGLDDDAVTDTCNGVSTADSFVGGVNFNAPGQVVIAGHSAAVDAALVALKDAGARRAMPCPLARRSILP